MAGPVETYSELQTRTQAGHEEAYVLGWLASKMASPIAQGRHLTNFLMLLRLQALQMPFAFTWSSLLARKLQPETETQLQGRVVLRHVLHRRARCPERGQISGRAQEGQDLEKVGLLSGALWANTPSVLGIPSRMMIFVVCWSVIATTKSPTVTDRARSL